MVAQACGGTGFRLEDPVTSSQVLATALATPGPVLAEAVVEPLEAPMPAKVPLDQATEFARALARGEPDRAAIAIKAVTERVRELV